MVSTSREIPPRRLKKKIKRKTPLSISLEKERRGLRGRGFSVPVTGDGSGSLSYNFTRKRVSARQLREAQLMVARPRGKKDILPQTRGRGIEVLFTRAKRSGLDGTLKRLLLDEKVRKNIGAYFSTPHEKPIPMGAFLFLLKHAGHQKMRLLLQGPQSVELWGDILLEFSNGKKDSRSTRMQRLGLFVKHVDAAHLNEFFLQVDPTNGGILIRHTDGSSFGIFISRMKNPSHLQYYFNNSGNPRSLSTLINFGTVSESSGPSYLGKLAFFFQKMNERSARLTHIMSRANPAKLAELVHLAPESSFLRFFDRNSKTDWTKDVDLINHSNPKTLARILEHENGVSSLSRWTTMVDSVELAGKINGLRLKGTVENEDHSFFE